MKQETINFTCPRCDKEFSLEQLINHNAEAFNELINSKAEEKMSEKAQEITKSLKSNFEKEQQILKQNLEANHLKKINELTNSYNQQLHQITSEKDKSLIKLQELEKNQANLMETNKLTIKNAFTDEINQLKEQISTLKNELTLQNEKHKAETEKIQKNLTEVYTSEKEVLEKTYRDQIEELRIKNAENRILQSKTKGENWETEVSSELHKAFGFIDKIEKITKTTEDKKADYLQTVRNGNRQDIGKIVYEAKNAKWSNAWLPKLSVDIANNKAKYGILVVSSFHDEYQIDTGFKQSDDYENIWITDPFSFIFVAQIIRKLIEVEYNYNWKEMKLVSSSNDKLFKEYQAKILAIKEYMQYGLPPFIKTFNKQIEDIIKVEGSLRTNADKLNKSVEKLQKQFDKDIKKKLEKLTGEHAIELEDSQMESSETDQTVTDFN